MDKKVEKDNKSSEVHNAKKQEDWDKFSFFIHIFLPVAGLVVLFKQKHILSRLFLQLDRNCVSVLCPSFSRREKLLKWAGSRLPETWSSQSRTLAGGVADLWSDGSLLCTLINSAIPGACPNPHRHWKKPPLHAQAIAYKYLGVIPIFTESDFNGGLTLSLERNFLQYLNEVQQAINKLSERNDTPKNISLHYVARGMGLYSGEQHRKTVFYVYPNKNALGHNNNIIVHIRGPYATYGKAIIPTFHNNLFTTPEVKITTDLLATKKLLSGNIMKPRNTFINNFSLPFMQYHKKHMGDNIIIDVKMENERAKVTYIPKNYGMYEIIMVSNGELVRGCPFSVHILNNVSGIEDSFDSEDKLDDIPSLRKRKVLSKTIDFIDEQMPITELLSKYNNKEEHIDIGSYKQNKDIEKNNKRNVVEEKKMDKTEINLNEPVPIKHILNLVKSTEKIDEENKEYLLSSKENDCTNIKTNDVKTEMTNEATVKKVEAKATVLERPKMSQNISVNIDKKLSLSPETIHNDINKLELNSPLSEKIGTVLEKHNSEFMNEKRKITVFTSNGNNIITDHILKENKQPRDIIHNVNNYTDNRSTYKVVNNNVSEGLQLKSTNDGEIVENTLDKEKKMFSNVPNKVKLNFNPRKVEVHKIKIPEKFCEQNLTETDGNGLNAKHLKNVINSSNRREKTKTIYTKLYKDGSKYLNNKINYVSDADCSSTQTEDFDVDDNNNIPSLTKPDMNRKIPKTDKIVPTRFLQNNHHLQNVEAPLYTSPICPDHIVPEVENEYVKMSVAERRKIFAKKTPNKTYFSSTNSSFSEIENAEGSPSRRHFKQYEGLSVLNYLGSLKKSDGSSHRKAYSLCSTVSLPNISSMETGTFQNSVKERRNFWEKMSSSTSSLSVNSELLFKRKPKKMTETERCRLIWRKPQEPNTSSASLSTTDHSDLEQNVDISKSADDILSITNFASHGNAKKYRSMDHSLDTCTMMSIEERKNLLLKQNHAKEKPKKQASPVVLRISTKENLLNKNEKIVPKNVDQNDDVVFSSILDRIKKYDRERSLSVNKIEGKQEQPPNNSVSKKITTGINNSADENLQNSIKPDVLKVKSHFKRAVKYFKNLEEQSLNKSKNDLKQKDYKNYPLDIPSKYKTDRKGGSLNLPNVHQRFLVSNLYEDVVKVNKGTFKGAANRSALVEALATFSRRENHGFRDDEDNIMYELFRKKTKTKKRKSIRSIFDIYY